MIFAVGSLVKARGREWVVLPESEPDLLVLRPLGGTDREVAGIFLPLEGHEVESATFDLPDPDRVGDFRSCRLLRDAVRLGFRSSAGPFRSFARLNVEPRPYQLAPLFMALKLDPVRMLIADDVGIGKTIEACLIAREMLDRGEVQRLAVLCPPHLAEQWQDELRDKFHVEAELVLPSTVNRLERNTAVGQSLFDLYPFVVVSTEYIKSSRRRDDFICPCPEFVIVDEAHTCAFSADNRSGRHLRHQLIQGLAADAGRHLLLVTATPPSGDEGAFRSLLGLLRPDFRELPEDLSGRENEPQRRAVAAHLVQRRRADVRDYMEADTPFPSREEAEESYALTEEYRRLFESVLAYAQERVLDKSGDRRRQRVRWWSALALLRSLASSPAAAAATLRARSVTAATESAEEADDIGERAVLDLDDADVDEFLDATPGSQEEDDAGEPRERERLLRLARRAESLYGPEQDAKLQKAIALVKRLLADGFQPILFCRFIATAEYVADQLRQALPSRVEVAAVTGLLPPAEREHRVELLGEHPQRILVATDCLSEGVNLQDHFDAVVHYDLSWNPTRHEPAQAQQARAGGAPWLAVRRDGDREPGGPGALARQRDGPHRRHRRGAGGPDRAQGARLRRVPGIRPLRAQPAGIRPVDRRLLLAHPRRRRRRHARAHPAGADRAARRPHAGRRAGAPRARAGRAASVLSLGTGVSGDISVMGHESRVIRSTPPFRWDEARRFLLRCELDAAYFHLYGIERDDVEYILETFPIVKRKDITAHGQYRTQRVILKIYDEMAAAMAGGPPYRTRLDPPPADPRVCHPPRGEG